ncbi:hypothetical protein COLO4_20555 [Corchorus olitorius]|uniref:non-specific serine/threonine protein kinase n=1 Tax=Corchorus olitorius TaxID=93759 RepID=A0A1R3IZ24_9ROSI|nr:hypothetical protein COLO4_20555 [Corchorus olitorius]
MATAIVAIFTAIIVLSLILVLVKFVAVRKSKGDRDSKRELPPKPIPSKDITTYSGLYRFSKAEIENAIGSYNRRKSLGRGSAGEVYEGILPSGQVVAIKKIIKGNSPDSFTREVAGLSRIRHPNLVSLLGCCVEGDEQYLVLEYCSEGNLAQHLLKKDRVLSWERRVKILRDCAHGLRYLHNYIDGCIVHRDIKAKDVSMGNRPLTDFEDPRLNGNLDRTDFESILQIAVLCVARSSRGRPPIDVVFEEMEKAWKNTKANMKTREEIGPSASPHSRSMELISV